jgi:hypothetical protein
MLATVEVQHQVLVDVVVDFGASAAAVENMNMDNGNSVDLLLAVVAVALGDVQVRDSAAASVEETNYRC